MEFDIEKGKTDDVKEQRISEGSFVIDLLIFFCSFMSIFSLFNLKLYIVSEQVVSCVKFNSHMCSMSPE